MDKTQFIEIFKTSRKELESFRWFSIIAIIMVPLFGIALKAIDSNAFELMPLRYGIAAFLAIIFGCSFFSNWVKSNYAFLFYICIWLLTYLIVWIVFKNQFSPNYTVGLLLTFCCVAIVFRETPILLGYIISTIALIFFLTILSPKTGIDSKIIFLLFITIGGIYFVVLRERISTKTLLSTVNQRLEVRVIERTKELEISNEELEQFAYVASHDLKSPLRTIKGFVQLIEKKLKGNNDEELQEYMDYVKLGVDNMDRITTDLLGFSHYNKRGLVFAKHETRKVIDMALLNNNAAIEENKAKIVVNDIPDYIYCNDTFLQIVFQNLILNGIKFNENQQPMVQISAEEINGFTQFEVKDNGIGIDPAYQKKIFDMFQQLHSKSVYQGSGIGLALCKKIVRIHNGKIWVESKKGKGATFIFTIKA